MGCLKLQLIKKWGEEFTSSPVRVLFPCEMTALCVIAFYNKKAKIIDYCVRKESQSYNKQGILNDFHRRFLILNCEAEFLTIVSLAEYNKSLL